MPKGRGCKAKGDAYERELAAHINKATGLRGFRAPLSGGGHLHIGFGGADLVGYPGLYPEAKRVEKLNFHDALRQADANKKLTDGDGAPIVINRRNHMETGDSLVLMRLDDFLTFYRAWLEKEGHCPASATDAGFANPTPTSHADENVTATNPDVPTASRTDPAEPAMPWETPGRSDFSRCS